jgi:HAD superfamily hydrolase (TIGR01490 family)
MPTRTAAAFFDLDGTLTLENTGRLWFRRERAEGRLALGQAMEAAFWMGLYGVGLMRADTALSRAVGTLQGVDEAALGARIARFYEEEVISTYAPGGLDVVRAHQQRGEPVVLLTAASTYLAQCVQDDLGLSDSLALQFEVGADGRFTGGLVEPVCYGAGKVAHAERWAAEHGIDLAECTFYTDSITDLPMLERVGTPIAVHPDSRLARIARKRDWAIEDWGGGVGEENERWARLRRLAATAVGRLADARSRSSMDEPPEA